LTADTRFTTPSAPDGPELDTDTFVEPVLRGGEPDGAEAWTPGCTC